MIALNIPTLNAPAVPSPIATSFEAPVESTNSSAPSAQDFSAILTEMIGPVLTLPLPSVAGLPAAAVDPTNSSAPGAPGISAQQPQSIGPAPGKNSANAVNALAAANASMPTANTPIPDEGQVLQGPETPKTQERQKTSDTQQNQSNPIMFVPVAAVLVAHPILTEQKPIATHEGQTEQPQINGDPVAASMLASSQHALQPEIQRAWADVKKFEFTVQNEAERTDGAHVQPQVAPADVQKQAIVTTDPITNIQLQQLPPRITAIEKLTPDTKFSDRPKPEAAHESLDTTTPVAGMHFGDVARPIEQVEQARPAHQVEIPDIPHVPVVRTVAMEVGEADSQVTVRIQERAGDISLQINAANEPLHQSLQSSVGSLVQALKQGQVQVSNVEVSRKSPIDKVRRMKEAN